MPTILKHRKMYSAADVDAWIAARRPPADPVQEAITRLIAVAPPLSDEQKTAIRALFTNAAA